MGRGCAAVVLIVNHRVYRQLDLVKFAQSLTLQILVDGRRFVDAD
jgi:UDP-N-acetyl-D-mannosaminuronate dehydrogenase